MKTPAARAMQAAGALMLSLAVSHSSVALAPSTPRTEYDWTAWPMPTRHNAPERTERMVMGARPTPTPTAAPEPPREPVAAFATEPPTQPPKVREPIVDGRITGDASWYCNNDGRRGPISSCMAIHPDTRGSDAYAAAGPRLRAALGPHWRNRRVWVNGVPVVLADWCRCPNGRVIDLYADVAQAIGLLRRGHGVVVVGWR